MALEYGEYAMRVFGEVPQEEAALFLEWAAKAFPHARLTVEGEAPQGPLRNGGLLPGGFTAAGERHTGKAPPKSTGRCGRACMGWRGWNPLCAAP